MCSDKVTIGEEGVIDIEDHAGFFEEVIEAHSEAQA